MDEEGKEGSHAEATMCDHQTMKRYNTNQRRPGCSPALSLGLDIFLHTDADFFADFILHYGHANIITNGARGLYEA